MSPDKHKENLILLHEQLSTILSVMSSSRKVDLDKMTALCRKTVENISDNFKWAVLNHTLHGTIQHSVELMAMNDDYGLGSLSEECLEANNKDIRNYLQFLCRKTSPVDQMTDVMCRMLERSDPVVLAQAQQWYPRKYCTECGETDHTIRSHSRLFNLPKKLYVSLVEDILLD